MFLRHLALIAGLLLLTCSLAEAQKYKRFSSRFNKRKSYLNTFSVTAGVGVSSYYGDLKAKRTSLWVKPNTQLGLQYGIGKNLILRSEVMWYRITGADSLNSTETGIHTRNLSFQADNFEGSIVAMWQLFNKYTRHRRSHNFNPYAFTGIGLTTNNPKAYYNGTWVALRPLQTEGVNYSATALVVPVGFGLTYHVDNNWDISAEYGARITFTDYLDDVSTTHLGVENIDDPLKKALSDRRPEIDLAPLPAGGQRGNPSVKDYYVNTSIKVTYSPSVSGRRKYQRPKFR